MSLKISRILHAGYLFEDESHKIAFDPIFENPFSVNCFAFPAVEFDFDQIKNLKLDAVFISHYHDDHCSFESLNILNRETPIYLFCVFDEMFELVRKLGFKNVYSIELNKTLIIGKFEITPRPALDADTDSIYHIKNIDVNVLNVVDSWISPSTLEKLCETDWDLILWPFQTMREIEVLSPSRFKGADQSLLPELAQQLQLLKPRYLVPSACQFIHESWSWYRKSFFPISYARFKEEIFKILPETLVERFDPSMSFELTKSSMKKSQPLRWVIAADNNSVDYEYDPNLKPPTTKEISKNFSISTEQMKRVIVYCRSELSKRFESLEHSTEGYFARSRNWKLVVYDQNENAYSFNYSLKNGRAFLQDFFSSPSEANFQEVIHSDRETAVSNFEASWLTEIPAAKLYSALEQGESLSSLYIRINDCSFDPETEAEVKDSSPMEDPLLACLYNGAFATYQKAQLSRILKS